jgi:hypothetical protein
MWQKGESAEKREKTVTFTAFPHVPKLPLSVGNRDRRSCLDDGKEGYS